MLRGGQQQQQPTNRKADEASKETKVEKVEVHHDFAKTLSAPNMPQCSVDIDPADISYTLVIQLDDNRLWVMRHHCTRWSELISLAVLTDEMESTIVGELEEMGCRTENIRLSILPARDHSPDAYPVNRLRNMAIGTVTTSHFLFIDADFWMSEGVFDVLVADGVRRRLAGDHKQAIVLPAFQMRYSCPPAGEGSGEDCQDAKLRLMPRTMEQLLRGMEAEEGTVSIFDYAGNPHGHDSTDYNRWVNQPRASLEDIHCIKSERYEPYLVMRRCGGMPPFQEAFAGYGWNKISFIVQLQRAGYRFAQLGGAYLVHFPHGDSTAKKVWMKDPKANKKVFREFKMWLSEHPDEERVPRCPTEANFVDQMPGDEVPSCVPVAAKDISYTMVSQFSSNRLWLMRHQCAVWKGPMSLAVFTDRDADSIIDELVSMGCDGDFTVQTIPIEEFSREDYPVNALRNLALTGVATSHFFYVDVDFMMSDSVERTLMRESVRSVLSESPKQTIVVPAFQRLAHCDKNNEHCNRPKPSEMPVTKSDLVEGIYSGDVTVFDSQSNPDGHGSTRYNTWMGQRPGSVVSIPCLTSDRYEPYIVAQYCKETPPFQEDFIGYSSDKLEVRLCSQFVYWIPLDL